MVKLSFSLKLNGHTETYTPLQEITVTSAELSLQPLTVKRVRSSGLRKYSKKAKRLNASLLRRLKLFMPDLVDVYYGDCGGVKSHYSREWIFDLNPPFGGAHTHVFPCDPTRFRICVSSPDVIFLKNGYPSDLMWHEYAHVLDPTLEEQFVKCGMENGKLMHEYKSEWEPHGDGFHEMLRQLGVAGRISGPYVSTQEYGQAAAFIVKKSS